MKIIPVKCPNCNADIEADEGQTRLFCKYCGAQLLLEDGIDRHEYVYIDKSRIIESENDKLIRLKEMEIEQEEKQHKRNLTKAIIIFSAVFFFLAFILWHVDNVSLQYVGIFFFFVTSMTDIAYFLRD